MEKQLGNWGLYPEGQYKFRLVDVEVKAGIKSPYIQWKLEILEPTDLEGETLVQIVNLSNHRYSQQIAKAWLLAFGCEEEDEVPTDDLADLTAFLKRRCIGKVAKAFLGKRVDEYGSKNEVKPPDGIFKADKSDDNIPF
jgi:hypothetical protein